MKHPSHVLGREVDQKTVDGFNKHKSRAAVEGVSGRSISGLVKGFKESVEPV
ncbi:hypothetical protein KEJ21_01575 [Candidatus Bathyarchaeota archaeon]|nr:hypothetical protein [Candidatus Bathyarchaeota archaeon]MBS7630874.1 hypothetical protein [Candidatus Bathyarchaeota archaeon]